MLLLSWSSLGEVGHRSYCTLAFCSPSVINFHHEASCGSSLIRDQSWRLRSRRAWARKQRCWLRASARTIFGRESHVFVFWLDCLEMRPSFKVLTHVAEFPKHEAKPCLPHGWSCCRKFRCDSAARATCLLVRSIFQIDILCHWKLYSKCASLIRLIRYVSHRKHDVAFLVSWSCLRRICYGNVWWFCSFGSIRHQADRAIF